MRLDLLGKCDDDSPFPQSLMDLCYANAYAEADALIHRYEGKAFFIGTNITFTSYAC
jgi:hypothetical protein